MIDNTATCPYCLEIVKRNALRCKHCHSNLTPSESEAGHHTTIGGYFGITVGGSDNRIEGGIHLTLGEFDQINPDYKAELRRTYETRVREFPEQAQYHFALGLCYLDLRLYALSIGHLSRALGKSRGDATVLYYLALASTGGKRPKVLRFATVRTIEEYLRAAIQLDDRPAHYKMLWAIMKHDYYLMNGLRIDPPGIEDLLSAIGESDIDSREILSMLKHLPIPPNPLTEVLRRFTETSNRHT